MTVTGLATISAAHSLERAGRMLAGALGRLSDAAERRRAQDELRRLPDRALDEIGLRRIDLLAIDWGCDEGGRR